MLIELEISEKLVGIKQSKKAIKDNKAKKVFIASNAQEYILQPIIDDCVANGIPIERVATMAELGKACGIDVGAAIAVLLK